MFPNFCKGGTGWALRLCHTNRLKKILHRLLQKYKSWSHLKKFFHQYCPCYYVRNSVRDSFECLIGSWTQSSRTLKGSLTIRLGFRWFKDDRMMLRGENSQNGWQLESRKMEAQKHSRRISNGWQTDSSKTYSMIYPLTIRLLSLCDCWIGKILKELMHLQDAPRLRPILS